MILLSGCHAAPSGPSELATAQLLALGYTDEGRTAAGSGVTRHDPSRSEAGLNLVLSGHAPEALLITMDGELLHRWRLPFAEAFVDHPLVRAGADPPGSWRRVHLLPDGSLLAIYEGFGLIRIDRDSRLLWADPRSFHHDLDVGPDGRIFAIFRRPQAGRSRGQQPATEDLIAVLSLDGEPQAEIALLPAFERGPHRGLLRYLPPHGDLLHTNTLELLDGSQAAASPWLAAGNLLISPLMLDAVAILDPKQGAIVWARRGAWRAQHQPTLTANAGLLLLDNRGLDGSSRLLEFGLLDSVRRWSFPSEGSPEPFFTATCGSVQRLPGGNTLAVESEGGRAIEITPEGDVVWEYYNPARAGAHGELAAMLFDVRRLVGVSWLGN